MQRTVHSVQPTVKPLWQTGAVTHSTPRVSPWHALVLLPLGLATVVSALAAAFVVTDAHRTHRSVDWVRFMEVAAVQWYFWAALVPVVGWLQRRWPLQGRTPWPLAFHLFCAAALSIVHGGAYLVLEWIVAHPDQRASIVTRLHAYLGSFAYFDVFAYAAILGAGYALDYHSRLRQEEMRALELREELSEARIAVLRSQLQPHFLFNTLHAIGGLVRRNRNADALSMVVGLADLLRHSLDRARTPEVSLDEEIQFLERYLHIQQMRFENRLLVSLNVSTEARRAFVPTLILQPLVENALEHGVANRAAPTRVVITADRVTQAVGDQADTLVVSVFNEGPALVPQTGSARLGTGLSNVRARLDHAFGSSHEFTMRNTAGGVIVRVAMPWKVEGP